MTNDQLKNIANSKELRDLLLNTPVTKDKLVEITIKNNVMLGAYRP